MRKQPPEIPTLIPPDSLTLHGQSALFPVRAAEIVLQFCLSYPIELTQSGRYKVLSLNKLSKLMKKAAFPIEQEHLVLLLDYLKLGGALRQHEREANIIVAEKGEALLEQGGLNILETLLKGACSPLFDIKRLEYFQTLLKEAGDGNHQSDRNEPFYAIERDWPLTFDSLAALPKARQWVRLADLIQAMATLHPNLFLYYPKGMKKPEKKDASKERKMQEKVLAGFFDEIACPLGLAEWAIGANQELIVRLSDIGNQLFHSGRATTQSDADKEGPALVIQPDFEVVAFLDRMSFDDALTLLSISVALDEHTGNTPVIRHKIVKEAVEWAIRHGRHCADILEYLNDLSGGLVPTNIETELNEWAKSIEAISLFRGYELLQYTDSVERDEAMQSEWEPHPIGERMLLVRKRQRRNLHIIDYETRFPKCIEINKAGQIRLLENAPPDLQLLTLLQEIATPDDDEGWRISAEAVRTCKREWHDIAELLQSRAIQFPASLFARLAGFSGQTEPALAADFKIVKIDDGAIFKGIMDDETTGAYVAHSIGNHLLLIEARNFSNFMDAMEKLHLPVTFAHFPLFNKPIDPNEDLPIESRKLDGFQLVEGYRKKHMILQAIESKAMLDILMLDKEHFYSPSRILKLRVQPLAIDESDENAMLHALFVEEGQTDVLDMSKIQALRIVFG